MLTHCGIVMPHRTWWTLGSGNDLAPSHYLNQCLTNHHWDLVAFTWGQFHRKCPRYIWVRSQRCGCLVTWFCYQMIAKPGRRQQHLRDLTHIHDMSLKITNRRLQPLLPGSDELIKMWIQLEFNFLYLTICLKFFCQHEPFMLTVRGKPIWIYHCVPAQEHKTPLLLMEGSALISCWSQLLTHRDQGLPFTITPMKQNSQLLTCNYFFHETEVGIMLQTLSQLILPHDVNFFSGYFHWTYIQLGAVKMRYNISRYYIQHYAGTMTFYWSSPLLFYIINLVIFNFGNASVRFLRSHWTLTGAAAAYLHLPNMKWH